MRTIGGGRIDFDVFPALRSLIFGSGFQMDDDQASGVTGGDGFLEFDGGEAEIFRGDSAEDVRGHHAHRRAAENLFAEGAASIAEHDFVVGLIDDEKIATDAAFEIDERIGDLLAIHLFGAEGGAIARVDAVADALADEADKTAGLVEADDVFKFSRELPDQ